MGHHRKSQALTPLSRPVACFYGNQQLLWGEFCITGFPGGSDSKESACNAGEQDSIPGLGRCPGDGMAAHSSILAWRILRTEEPGL